MRARLFLFVLVAGALFWRAEARAQCVSGTILLENDIDGRGTDHHYTHGTRFSCISAAQDDAALARKAARALQFDAFGVPMLDASGEVRYTLALGQSIFTPTDLARYSLITDDRPYAGWLYGTVGLVLGPSKPVIEGSASFDRVETLELSLGMVGPGSFAEQTQKFVHSTINAPYPQGWQNQLHNEPGFILSYEDKWRTEAYHLIPGSDWLEYDVMPSVGASVGNVQTYAKAGLTFRLGDRLTNDFGPPRIRPSVAGSDYYNPRPDETLGWYLFLTFGGRAVARNIFLDGNTFRSSPSVDKKYLVGDIQFGAVVSVFGKGRLALTHIIRSPEFRQQRGHDEFSGISLTFPL